MITYKELRNLQNLERENNELQPLGEGFVSEILNYLNEKRESIKSVREKDSVFSRDAQAEIRNELKNAIIVIQDIYERRERKVLSQAVLTVKTESSLQDTSRMLDFEKEMFADMVKLLRRYRESFFGPRKEKKTPSQQPEDEQPDEADEVAEPGAEMKTVRMVKDVPQFVWSDGRTYGPFSQEDVLNVDTRLASMLISGGSAEPL